MMKKGALFKTVRVLVVLLVSAAVAFLLVQLRPRAEKQERVSNGRLVETVTTRSQSLPMFVEAYGTVAPREALKLVARVRGEVVALHPNFIEGGFVRSGEVLVAIDPQDYELAVRRTKVGIRQAEADLDRLEQDVLNLDASLELARADMKLALAEVKRLKKLAGKDMTSQSVLDKADRQYLTSRERLQALENQMALIGPNRVRLQSQLEMARVAWEQAKLDLERCRIEAPYEAWVTQKTVEIGQHLSVGQPVGSIYRAGAFDIEVKIPVGDLAWFPDGAGSGEGLKAEVRFSETEPPRIWIGKVARIKAALDQTTRTLPVVVQVDEATGADPMANAAGRMKPGMFVTVRIQGRQVDHVHRLPRHLVRDDDTVYLAVDDRLEIRPVAVLRRFKTEVLINEGLADGDRVITTPISNAVSGMKIRIK
ncbi:efflux RND transporter periplasmic adaptor subunit [uncultured Desulfosarcina sp.]|uniref:efflux RND transporter periplasmic adaptor subunit n=1 Tax=uncultured Desulfosarcina sp. TaxID=218289 RepID=UPI0029C68119|nr:efflux RND transporter periplasmic adaptor subunit [uncultured Desulfosarcina sp.]